MGGLDLAPMVVLLAIFFLRKLMFDNWGIEACRVVRGTRSMSPSGANGTSALYSA